MSSKIELGKELKKARKVARYSQASLAEESRISLAFIKAIELDKQTPTISTVFKLARALETTPEQLLQPAWDQWLEDVEKELKEKFQP